MSLPGLEEEENHHYPVTQVLKELENIIYTAHEAHVQNENFTSLMLFLERIGPILATFQNVQREDLPTEVQTAVTGVEAELRRVVAITDKYAKKSRFFVLIHSPELVQSVQEISSSLGQWLSLIPLVQNPEIQELKKKILELSREMQAAQFKVSDNEQIVLATLEKEAQNPGAEVGPVQLVMSQIARTVQLDPVRNRDELLKEVQRLINDIRDRQDEHEQQLAGVIERLLKKYVAQTEDNSGLINLQVGEDDPIPAFETFLCPLTRLVMKDPVVIESEQTYERNAIEQWFQQCRDQGWELSCPLTGRKLTVSELRPNYGLRQTIEEWTERNIKKRIEIAVTHLTPSASVKDKEHALNDIFRIAEESSSNKYKLKEAGVIPLILNIWQCQVEDNSHLDSKALKALLSMAVNNSGNKVAMVEAGAVKVVVKSMNCNSDKEKESAFKLMFELSKQSEICERICSQKGAILYLSGATVNIDNLSISTLAEKTLQNLEQEDSTVWLMAESGRLRPLLKRLRQGPEEIQVQMANYLAQITLLNSAKEHVAKAAAPVLVQMLSSHVNAKEAGLGALLNLSTFDDNSSILIKSGILRPLINIIFNVHATSTIKVNETASDLLANLVARPGHWEVAHIDSEGNTLQSQIVIHNLLGLLTHVATDWKQKLLRALFGMASSPQAAGTVAEHFKSGEGLPLLVNLLEGNQLQALHSLRVLNAFSFYIGTDIVEALRKAKKLAWLKETARGNIASSSEEQAIAAILLSDIPLTDQEVTEVLGVDLIEWITFKIADITSNRIGSSSSGVLGKAMLNSLLGLLLHFTRSNDRSIIEKMKEHQLLLLFKEQLILPVHKLVKQRAAIGMQLLSQKSGLLARDSEPPPSKGFCAPLVSLCIPRPPTHHCSVHLGICEANQTFCLVQAEAVRPLVELLEEDDVDLQTVVTEAISTLLNDSVNFRGGVQELLRVEGVQLIFDMFVKLRTGNLQEKTVWIVERCLRVDECAQHYLIDQRLFKALVEVFKHGSPIARHLAQEGLAHLKRLSGVAMKGKRARA